MIIVFFFFALAEVAAVVSCFLPHSFPYMSSIFFFLSSPEPIVFRLAFENPEASNYHQNPREVSSTHSSPYKTLPRPPREPHSMPPTPVMTRNSYSSSHLRCDLHSSALSLRSLLFNLQSPASVVEVAATVCFFRPVQDSNSNLSYTLSPLFQ